MFEYSVDGMFFLMLLLAAFGGKHLLAEELFFDYDTCPFENSLYDVRGFRTVDNECVSIVSRTYVGKENASLAAAVFCAKYFKQGRLGYMDSFQGESNGTDEGHPYDNDIKLFNGTGQDDNWNYFMCIHQPYLDCLETELIKCNYVFELGSCVWQYSYVSMQEAEKPYGRRCRWVHESVGSPCQCNKCDKTQWTPWTRHIDAIGTVFQTRYRPLNIYMNVDCLENSTYCCGEYSVLRSFFMLSAHPRIRCLNGGRLLIMGSSEICKCPSDTNGWFCELDKVHYGYGKRRFLRWGLIGANNIAFFFSSLLVFLFACVPCLLLQSRGEAEECDDENGLPVVSVVPNAENDTRCAKHLITIVRPDSKADQSRKEKPPSNLPATVSEQKGEIPKVDA